MKINKKALELMLISKTKLENSMIEVEECSELQKAITKIKRHQEKNEGDFTTELKTNLVEEIADVYIIIEMLKLEYNILEEELQEVLDKKMCRNILRQKGK